MTATMENAVLHMYVVTQGSETSLLCLMDLGTCFSQAAKTEEVYVHQT
jgi:hypothetical protein